MDAGRTRLHRRPLAWAGGVFLLAWFLFFSRGVLSVHFAPDDMMNADSFYWTPGWARAIASQFLPWSGYYRPMGGLFYMPLVSLWGLDPAPYHVVLSLVLAVSVGLVYRLARLLEAAPLAAFLAALAACYHAGLGNLYYNTAFIYDALCGCFYLATLVCYCGVRRESREFGARQLALFGVLLLCALNSKEMALTIPGALLAYEWIYHPLAAGRLRDGDSGGSTVVSARRPIALAALLVILDFYGKVFGHDALTAMEGYRPVFTWQRFLAYQRTFLHDAAFWETGGWGVLAFWVLVTYLAWRPGARRVLRFCWALLVLTPLPIEFLPGKSQACLYIPALALAIFAAVVIADLAGALADVLTGEPLFRRLSRQTLLAGLVAVAVFCWGRENRRRELTLVDPSIAALGAQTWQVIEQFRALHPQVRPHSHVVFLNDPFTAWDMLFIADLWFRDRTVTVHLQRLAPLPESALSAADVVYDYRGGQLLRVR